MKSAAVRSALMGAAALWFSPLVATAQVFSGLGMQPGSTQSRATAISDDGTTVVGWEFGGINVGWRHRLGSSTDYFDPQTRATGVSADGSVVVGYPTNVSSTPPAFRWTAAGGIQFVPEVRHSLDPDPAISANGTYMVGRGENGGVVRWSETTGPFQLPNPPTGSFTFATTLYGLATNFDGAVVVGGAGVLPPFPGMSYVTPYRWSAATGTQLLTLPDGTHPPGSAFGVSADGNIVLTAGDQVGRWQASTGIVIINGLTVNGGLALPALSADGNTIVSIDKLWTTSHGVRTLTDVLTDAGCDFSGWSNLIATDVSGNGLALCGYGQNPQGHTEAWYATVPSPGTVMVLAPALLWRRRRSCSG